MSTVDDLIQESRLAVAIEAQELNLVLLHKLIPFREGNQWCYMLGANIQEGICGFGFTPLLAAYDFNRHFNTEQPMEHRNDK